MKKMKTFKDLVKEDIDKVFLNINEFAENIILEFSKDLIFKTKGTLTNIESTWVNPRLSYKDLPKEGVILGLNNTVFENYKINIGIKVKVNGETYYIKKATVGDFTTTIILGRKAT
ncbi:hypothetical protein [uncultured Cetobacterium sp.]|uniref:hypothetical protein n=2 Tax=uncultured Cetobacterium sp. TaxID=527638 RepID=UPI002639F96E|nr:hypothetical protein [uncultured Cetobacterium sp.]